MSGRNATSASLVIVSDCGAIDAIQYSHNYTNTTDATCSVAMGATTDLDCGSFYQSHLADAVRAGAVPAASVSEAATRLFALRLELGEFDPASANPFAAIGPTAVNAPAHLDLALAAAREGIVLLNNAEGILPLRSVASVALIGPHAAATSALLGNYYGVPPFIVSPEEGFSKYVPKLAVEPGCATVLCNETSGFAAAIGAASAADAVVLLMGIDTSVENEGNDRVTIDLPGFQAQLCREVVRAAAGPVVLVVMSGGPVDFTGCAQYVSSVLWTGYPGMFGGQAIADAVMHASGFVPGGRLPVTVYPATYVNQVSMFNMSFRAGPGRTYQFFEDPIYPALYGLSYMNITYGFYPGVEEYSPLIIQVMNFQ